MRRVSAAGGFATVLRKGDSDRGTLLLLVTSRGQHTAALERVLDVDRGYSWHRVGPPESASSGEITEFLASRARFDEDSWAIELDVADSERFIAETIDSG